MSPSKSKVILVRRGWLIVAAASIAVTTAAAVVALGLTFQTRGAQRDVGVVVQQISKSPCVNLTLVECRRKLITRRYVEQLLEEIRDRSSRERRGRDRSVDGRSDERSSTPSAADSGASRSPRQPGNASSPSSPDPPAESDPQAEPPTPASTPQPGGAEPAPAPALAPQLPALPDLPDVCVTTSLIGDVCVRTP